MSHSIYRRNSLRAALATNPEEASALATFPDEVIIKGNRYLLQIILGAGQDALREAGRGWFPKSDLSIALGEGQPFQLKLVGFKRMEIVANVKAISESLQKIQKQGVNRPLAEIAFGASRSLVRLFASYYDLCPWDLWRHHELVDAALWGAYRSYWGNKEQVAVALSVATFLETNVVMHALTEAEGESFVSGLTHEHMLNQRRHTILTQLTRSIQSLLFPVQWKQSLALDRVEADPIAEALLPDVLRIVFGIRYRRIRGRTQLRGRAVRPGSWEWRGRARKLGQLLAPYLEQSGENRQPSSNPFDQRRRPETGDGVDSGAPRPIENCGNANPFDQAIEANGVGNPIGGSLAGPAGNRPDAYNDFDAMNEYYSKRAGELVIRDRADEEDPRREPQLLTVGYQSHEKAELADLVHGNIDWYRTRLCPITSTGETELQFYRRTEPYEVPIAPIDDGHTEPPHLLILADSSSSMKFEPRATDPKHRGQFDLVLLACWGIFRHLESQNLGRAVEVCAINFSSATRASEWHPCSDLDPVKRTVAAYQGGGTQIDTDIFQDRIRRSPGRFLAIVITDGHIGNTPQVLNVCSQLVEEGHDLVLFHIGSENPFTLGIKALDRTVHLLTDAGDLTGLCLELAQDRYTMRRLSG